MTTRTKTFPAQIKAIEGEGDAEDEGVFEAIVSVFGNVDMVGDRVVKGAFEKTLKDWEASGDPIPVIWNHDWFDPMAHLGVVLESAEREEGLWVKGKVDLDTAFGAQVWRLLKTRRVKEFSFAYDIVDERKAKDGANELLELELFEVGPTLKGANPATQLLGSKSGRVLSAKNETAIREAVALLQSVLTALEREDDDAKSGTGGQESRNGTTSHDPARSGVGPLLTELDALELEGV